MFKFPTGNSWRTRKVGTRYPGIIFVVQKGSITVIHFRTRSLQRFLFGQQDSESLLAAELHWWTRYGGKLYLSRWGLQSGGTTMASSRRHPESHTIARTHRDFTIPLAATTTEKIIQSNEGTCECKAAPQVRFFLLRFFSLSSSTPPGASDAA